MTDRVKGFTVVLDSDVREDSPYVAQMVEALRLHKGVVAVVPVIADANDALVRLRLLSEVRDGLQAKIGDLLAELAR